MPRVGACWGDASILNFVGVVSFLPIAEGLLVLVSSMTQWKTQTAFQLTSRLLYVRSLQARCAAATRPAVEFCGGIDGDGIMSTSRLHMCSVGCGNGGYCQTEEPAKGRCCLTWGICHVVVEPTAFNATTTSLLLPLCLSHGWVNKEVTLEGVPRLQQEPAIGHGFYQRERVGDVATLLAPCLLGAVMGAVMGAVLVPACFEAGRATDFQPTV